MARSTCYCHEKRLGTSDGYDELRERIWNIYTQHHKRHRYRRITLQLRNEGLEVNHKTVQKLMNQMDLRAKRRKRKYRSYKGEIGKIAPNVLNRDFSTTAPERKWTTDVTEVKIKDRKIYLSPILYM